MVVGRVVRPHGVRGELRVAAETDFPERLAGLREVILVRGDRRQAAAVQQVRPHGGAVLMKLDGIDTPEAAAAWRGAAVAVPRAQAAPLPPGRHYVFEVRGLRVVTETGRRLGTVRAVLRTGANDVYAVAGPDGEILIPAISTVVKDVDPAAGRMVVRPLPGLWDA